MEQKVKILEGENPELLDKITQVDSIEAEKQEFTKQIKDLQAKNESLQKKINEIEKEKEELQKKQSSTGAEKEELAGKLGVKLTLVKGAGHFNEAAGYKEFPLLLEKIKKLS